MVSQVKSSQEASFFLLVGGMSGFEKKIKSISSCSPPGLFFGPPLSIEGGPVQTHAHCEQTVGRLANFSHLKQQDDTHGSNEDYNGDSGDDKE